MKGRRWDLEWPKVGEALKVGPSSIRKGGGGRTRVIVARVKVRVRPPILPGAYLGHRGLLLRTY